MPMSTEWTPVSDPPKKPGWYLVDHPEWSREYIAEWAGRQWADELYPTHYRELPPRAPQPDKFEEYWQGLPKLSDGFRVVSHEIILSKEAAESVWDAAMKAKEGK